MMAAEPSARVHFQVSHEVIDVDDDQGHVGTSAIPVPDLNLPPTASSNYVLFFEYRFLHIYRDNAGVDRRVSVLHSDESTGYLLSDFFRYKLPEVIRALFAARLAGRTVADILIRTLRELKTIVELGEDHTRLALNVNIIRRWETHQPMEENVVPSRAATKESIEALRKVQIQGGASEFCVVCQEDMSEGTEATVMACSLHLFHGDCLERWLNSNASCPICRFPMPTG